MIPARVISVAGGDLLRIALQEYGDALAWTRIAEANGLVDPWLSEPTRIIIPPAPPPEEDTGGVLGAV